MRPLVSVVCSRARQMAACTKEVIESGKQLRVAKDGLMASRTLMCSQRADHALRATSNECLPQASDTAYSTINKPENTDKVAAMETNRQRDDARQSQEGSITGGRADKRPHLIAL